jgi:hypothetical protein
MGVVLTQACDARQSGYLWSGASIWMDLRCRGSSVAAQTLDYS